ncbi:MAG: pyrroline-5-carboxylate reductase [Opitutaceae bacterium]|jgi:pyrroline-5-carboxylate reductase
MKLAFLGAGNMASAMVDGLLAKRSAGPADISAISGPDPTGAALAKRTGIRLAATIDELVSGADAVVVAFKPQHLASADPRLAEATAGRLVISILAGTRLARLTEAFPRTRNLVRCMPNTPGRIGAGITAWCAVRGLGPEDRKIVGAVLGALGRTVELPEAQLDAVTGLSGSGPAYVFEFAAALREAGVAAGLASDVADLLARETLLGAARLLALENKTPEQLRDEVTSPNGTTFAGLKRLSAGDFRGLIRETVLAAKARSEELSRA